MNEGSSDVLDPNDFQNIFFVFHRGKKVIQVWNNISVKWWQNFQFWGKGTL